MAAAQPTGSAALTDEKLLERITAGDETAFDLLYQRYFKRVYHFVAKRIGNRSDVEETVQEVFINVFNSLASFRGEGPFAAWVLGLTRRTIANRFKKRQHTTVPLDVDEAPGTIDMTVPVLRREATPLEIYECRERMEGLMETAARHLTPEQVALVERHHLEQESIQDIARSLGKSEDSIKSNLYRARKLLLAG